jgi:6-phosphogluconate dehydrogenase
MTIGYIGLGKMGKNMVLRLLEKKWRVVVYNRSGRATVEVARKGATPTYSLKELVANIKAPRLIWIMVPYKAVNSVLIQLKPLLKKGDTIIDGGNSLYKDSVRRYAQLKRQGINFLDVGVSGGPGGARKGACMMAGGERRIYNEYRNLFRDLTVKQGYGYMGKAGAGHFVKMVHNGIEYGMMQAIAEGFAVLKKSKYSLDMKEVTKVYAHGSVISSSLVNWLARAYREYGSSLRGISGKAAQSGEGLWTVKTAKRLGVTVKIIEESQKFRLQSQKKPSYTGKVLTALRNQFGGHSKKGNT